ncbi:rhodanese-like domain-containing protein [Eubacterium multiforme]|uniref:Rhodanese-related sulfurtransferase n=1 Tax=Eubacterium multiforme TaxID=83339 RepID=A0ABT9URD6_9FIRM|nr:rhodanese-like domain-containing protein [Eubacterium multiforme]MDQ0149027.1 rhodanese-related sulfurtransferase [Eubacterium multiforme]
MKEISTNKLQELIKKDPSTLIIDVREKDEFIHGHVPNSKNIPLSDIEDYSDDIPTDKPVYFICKSGNRSAHAVSLLDDLDIKNGVNVRGGMLSWDGDIEK